jgi:hypothetical protein
MSVNKMKKIWIIYNDQQIQGLYAVNGAFDVK